MEVIGGALLLTFCALLLRSLGWKGVPCFIALCLVLILSQLSDGIHKITSSLTSLTNYGELTEILRGAVKIVGVGYLFGICSDVCRELGENGIAKAVEIVGRVEIIIVVMPFLMDIINLGVELL